MPRQSFLGCTPKKEYKCPCPEKVCNYPAFARAKCIVLRIGTARTPPPPAAAAVVG